MVEVIMLDSIDALTASRVGGKADNLGQLISGGFQVPPGAVVPVEVYERFLDKNGLRLGFSTELGGHVFMRKDGKAKG
jgi:phosphoenolpyruvate synthase/pyruvate phosphate dikinase